MNGAVTAPQVAGSPRCRSCGAPIWFGRTAKNKRMPIDTLPVEDGNVIVDADMVALDRLADIPDGCPIRVLSKGETPDPDVPRYSSHFATCPKVDRHRRPRDERAKARNKSKARAMGMETRP